MSEDLPGVFLLMDRSPGGTHKIKLATKSVQLLSCAQVFIGLVSIGCQTSILILFAKYLDNVTTTEGIYCGVLYLFSGLVGFMAANRLTPTYITTHAVISLISTIFGLHLFVFSSINILHWSHPWKRSYYKAKYSAPAWLFSLLYSSMLVCSVVEVMVGLASSLLCYRASRCCRGTKRIPNIFYLSKDEDHGSRGEGNKFSAVYATQKNEEESDTNQERVVEKTIEGGSGENMRVKREHGNGMSKDGEVSSENRGGWNQGREENNKDRRGYTEDGVKGNNEREGCDQKREEDNKDRRGYTEDGNKEKGGYNQDREDRNKVTGCGKEDGGYINKGMEIHDLILSE